MQMFTVKTIRRTCSWINGVEAHLDLPVFDPAGAPGGLLTISGWIASREDPVKHVWVACVGRKLASAKMFARPDVRAAYPDRKHVTGFEIATVPLGLGATEPLRLMLEGNSRKRTALFELELDYDGSVAQAPSGPAAGIVFAPIVALPRSGTTYLAQLLHASDAVLGDDQYPYELRFGEHVANEWLLNVQPWAYAAPADRTLEITGPNYSTICEILRANGDGPSRDVLDASRRYQLDQIARLYRLAADKPHGFVITEKIGLGVELDLLAGLGAPVKPIFVIRDPRDAMLSMRRFNEKRGVYEFHEPRTFHFNDVVFQTALDLFNLTRVYDRWPGDKLLIRYEDLVADPQRVLREALAFIGVDAGAGAAAASAPAVIHEAHITSPSATESVGRWRSELTPMEIDLVNWYFGAFLQRFGFEAPAA